MLDSYLLRNNLDEVINKLKTRGFKFDNVLYQELEEKRKKLQVQTQELQNEKNIRSKEIGQLKAKKEDIDFDALRNSMQESSKKLDEKKLELNQVLEELDILLLSLPNLPDTSVPVGKDESENKFIRSWGEPLERDFKVKAHDELGESLKQMDFATAAKITGSRFVVLKSQLAKLHRALIQFMLDMHLKHGYQEVYVPYIVNKDSLLGTGQLPKFSDDLFKLSGDNDYYLTSTAEIPVTNLVRDLILKEDELPLKFVCHSPCFRSEAGSYGKDTKGIIRQHQFEKVELVWVTEPEKSFEALEKLTTHAEMILQKLNLPYRVMLLCTGDMGAAACKTYDLEVWVPSQQTYREISSCSNMGDFQARRMQSRFKDLNTKKTKLVHTLNGSALAIGRTLVAIMENYQDKYGNIHIPEVLIPYMGNIEVIKNEKDVPSDSLESTHKSSGMV